MINELLKPRIKLIAEDPFITNEVGSYLERKERDGEFFFIIKTKGADHWFCLEQLRKYPHLFKESFWWEERQKSELPEYVRWSKSEIQEVMKVIEWENSESMGLFCKVEGSNFCNFPGESALLPATKDEYEQFTSKQIK